MKDKIKITAVAGVAVCSMISVANASEVNSSDVNPNVEYKTLKTQQTVHPYEMQIDSKLSENLSTFNPLGLDKKVGPPKRVNHMDPDDDDRSFWEKIWDFLTTKTSSDSRL